MYALYIVVCPFVHLRLAIALSVLLRYMDSDYPFGIFKLFILQIRIGLLHTLIYALKLTVVAGKEQSFMTNNVIVKFHL
jgi:hypothetical protein